MARARHPRRRRGGHHRLVGSDHASRPEERWGFRLEQVGSINASGHKFGLVYPGVGWLVFRDRSFLAEDLVFSVNYLGGAQPTFTFNFSRGSATAILGATYFVGSLFFTSAALLVAAITWFDSAAASRSPLRTPDWWAAMIQLVGTVWFNVNTFHALPAGRRPRGASLG